MRAERNFLAWIYSLFEPLNNFCKRSSVSNEEIKDPNTGESLGHLEIVKGTGRVVHLQDKVATIESDKTRSYLRKSVSPYGSFLRDQEVIEVSELVPFDNPQVGDFVKPI